MSELLEQYIPVVQQEGINTNKNATFNGTVTIAGVLAGGNTSTAVTAGATPAIDASSGNIFTLTPGEDETISISGSVAGQVITLIVLTSGITSRTLTFGTGFKSTGTLATGTTSGKYFIVSFISDGTNVYETSRTTAE